MSELQHSDAIASQCLPLIKGMSMSSVFEAVSCKGIEKELEESHFITLFLKKDVNAEEGRTEA
jgi:hypothetical protein